MTLSIVVEDKGLDGSWLGIVMVSSLPVCGVRGGFRSVSNVMPSSGAITGLSSGGNVLAPSGVGGGVGLGGDDVSPSGLATCIGMGDNGVLPTGVMEMSLEGDSMSWPGVGSGLGSDAESLSRVMRGLVGINDASTPASLIGSGLGFDASPEGTSEGGA
uniref:Uncharacterized protein n=1 Tax=Opuntia streptacantha TaxID=393608 RepID=A0A7C9EPJ2_OPUST